MRRSFESSDILNSDADGSYDISFFASSIGHTKHHSESVFAKFAGGPLSALGQRWKDATQKERKAFLLEHHEAAHHGLLFSTPAGVLLWRLNQVLSRDIHYISQTLTELGIRVPQQWSPEKWLNSLEFAAELARHKFAIGPQKFYLLEVIAAVEKLYLFKQVFFQVNAASNHARMTVGELLALCQFVYPYLQARCGTSPCVTWTTKLDPQTKVFPPGKAFNVLDIAECHAIAKELFILRAVGDREGFHARLHESTLGQFGPCFRRALEITEYRNEIGFNPHGIQMSAVVACSTKIELSQSETVELRLEEHLPWWNYGATSLDSIKQCAEALHCQFTQPLIGDNSKWLVFYPIDLRPSKRPDQTFNFLRTLASFGLDIQMHLIHQGAQRNLIFLMETVKHLNRPMPQAAFDSWNDFLFLNKAFVEYSDAIFYVGLDLAAVYKKDHPVRQLPGFARLELPWLQLLAHIINGAVTRRAMAVYAGKAIPRSDVLADKFEKLVKEYHVEFPGQPQDAWRGYAKNLSGLLTEIFGKGRDLPFGTEHLIELSRERFI
jgi:hypothetical protein